MIIDTDRLIVDILIQNWVFSSLLFFFQLKHHIQVHLLKLLLNWTCRCNILDLCLNWLISRVLIHSYTWTNTFVTHSLSVDGTLFEEAVGAVQFFLNWVVLQILLLFHQSLIFFLLFSCLILLILNHLFPMTWWNAPLSITLFSFGSFTIIQRSIIGCVHRLFQILMFRILQIFVFVLLNLLSMLKGWLPLFFVIWWRFVKALDLSGRRQSNRLSEFGLCTL